VQADRGDQTQIGRRAGGGAEERRQGEGQLGACDLARAHGGEHGHGRVESHLGVVEVERPEAHGERRLQGLQLRRDNGQTRGRQKIKLLQAAPETGLRHAAQHARHAAPGRARGAVEAHQVPAQGARQVAHDRRLADARMPRNQHAELQAQRLRHHQFHFVRLGGADQLLAHTYANRNTFRVLYLGWSSK